MTITGTRVPMTADEAGQMTARELDDATYEKAARESLERPSHYLHFGDDRMFDFVGQTLGHSRDSGTTEESNYRSVLRDMSALAEFLHPDEGTEWVSEHSAAHFLCGWIEHITVRVLVDPDAEITIENLTPEFIAVTNIAVYLKEQGPVYDESDHSDLESEQYYELWENVTWPDFQSSHTEYDRCDCDGPPSCDCVTRPDPLDVVDAEALFSEVANYASEDDPGTWDDEDIWDAIVRLAEQDAYENR